MKGLGRRVNDIVAGVDGRIAVCVHDIRSGGEVGVLLDEPLPMASVCKIPVLVAAFRQHDRGLLDLGERVEFTSARRCAGSGLLNAFDPGVALTLRDLLLMMIVVSDNAATDIVLERLGPEFVTSEMRSLGLSGIRVDRYIRDLLGDINAALDPRLAGLPFGAWDEVVRQHPDLRPKADSLDEQRRAVNEGASERDTATARDLARLCAQVARSECASPASCEAMVGVLEMQQLNGRLPRDLPAGVRFPHKTGTLGSGAVVNDAGILFWRDEPVASVAVLSSDVRDPMYRTADRLARIGQAVYDHYAEP